MKVCYISGAFPNMKCGVGDYTERIFSNIKEKNCESYVITSKNDRIDYEYSNNVFPIISKWNLKSIKIIINKIKEINPDIVHIQYPSDEYKKNIFINFLPLFIKCFTNTKVIVTIHEFLICSKLGKIRNLIEMNFSNKVIVVEKAYVEAIVKYLPWKKKNIEYVPIFSNIPKSNINNDEIFKIKRNLNIGENKIISYFGFINELKGVEVLINILNELMKYDMNVKLLLIGELNNENKYHKKILELIEKYNLKNRVIITGFVESSHVVANYLKISNVCILPFRNGVSERNGSFLAAKLQGIPVITTTKNKKINNDENVFYIPINNIEEAIDKTKYILENDICFKPKDEGSNAIDIIVDKHIKIYNEVKDGKKISNKKLFSKS